MSKKASTAVASPKAKLAEKPKRSAKAPCTAGAMPETGVASVSSERLRVPLASEESADEEFPPTASEGATSGDWGCVFP